MTCFTAPETLYKQPTEKRLYAMNFAALMQDAETILSSPAPVVTSERINGGTSDLVIEDIVISGKNIEFWISEGFARNRYRIEIVVHTSSGQILEGDGILVVGDK